MKILHELAGSHSSRVELVEDEGVQYVLKTCEPEEAANERLFLKELADHGIPSLQTYENSSLTANQLLLEYVLDSPKMPETTENFVKFGQLVRAVHNINYKESFKVSQTGERQKVNWDEHIKSVLKQNIDEQRDKKSDLSDELLKAIEVFVLKGLSSHVSIYSLLHLDLHTGNVLMRGTDLILFDKGSEIFAGDPLFDLTAILLNYPNGTYVVTDHPDHQHDKEFVSAFIEGYGTNFLAEKRELFDAYFVVKTLGRYPNPFEIHAKSALESLVRIAERL